MPSRIGARAIAAALGIAAAAIALRAVFGPQFDVLDDAGYLDAALRVGEGRSLDNLFPLFRTRVGMAYPLGVLLSAGWLAPSQFWLLTMAAEFVTLLALAVSGWLLTGTAAAGLCAAALYAIYPLAVQQSVMYYPTAFQVASVAVACALIAAGEKAMPRWRMGFGFAAGLTLGIGYLFKEDVAIAVPAVVLAAAVVRFPRLATAVAVCCGAALVFAIECGAYWWATGDPLFRLSATSGLAAPASSTLQIAEIMRWDAYLRSLLMLPAQVGLIWWVALASLWFAWRHRASMPGVAFIAVTFVALVAYLQFGSGSFPAYSPLPKTPRYTAIATPALMLLTGAYLGWLTMTHRRAAAAVAIVVAVVAVPCIVYLHLASSERTRNTIAALPALESIGQEPLYTDFYSARVLRLLLPGRDIRVWYHARFDPDTMLVVSDPTPGSYVLLDRQSAKVYTSSYRMALPAAVEQQPAGWTPIAHWRAYPESTWSREFLEGLQAAATWLPTGNPVSSRVDRNVTDMIDGDQATLYRVPQTAARSVETRVREIQ